MAGLEELHSLQADLQEVERLLEQSTRERVRKALTLEKGKLQTEIANREAATPSTQNGVDGQESSSDDTKPAVKRRAPPPPGQTGMFKSKITSYGWDQSDKFVKIYISLNGVQALPKDNIEVNFGEKMVDFLVRDLGGKNHNLLINTLLHPITSVSYKVKRDMVTLLLRKKDTQNWECLTSVEKKSKDKKSPKYDEAADPGDSLMRMMKQMYEDGDDEMKRTIAKAWTESRDKQGVGLGDMP